MKTISYSGYDCVLLENRSLHLLLTQSVGPRILSFGFQGGENLFAELPDFVAECPGAGTFHFRGGHRLWHAPEDASRTYLPDDAPVQITPVESGVLVTQNVETRTGLQKAIEMRLPDDSPRAVIVHRLTNHNLWEITCAPWTITQLKPGGVAILPQTREKTGLLPNRSLALWDYANMSDPNLMWGEYYILVNADLKLPFKVGFPNPRGWLAYWLHDTLFVKRARYEPQSAYYDFGSSSECYCCEQFLELETLAPIQIIAPNSSVLHVETWELYGDVERPRSEADAHALVERLNLDQSVI
jgi:hypothetical protein